jgi:NodT family efflux transporter outer membrane factor (OMF) lipoprotein
MKLTLRTLLCAACLTGCTLGPDYHRPTAPTADAFQIPAGWKLAQPANTVSTQAWWEDYHDPVLNQLMSKLNVNNQTIANYVAQYRQAVSLVQGAEALLFPSVTANAAASRSSSRTINGQSTGTQNNTSIGLSASWEPDIWGSASRGVEAQVATARSTEAALAAAQLSARVALAQAYFQLRITDIQRQMYVETLAAYKKSLDITRNQYSAGIARQLDVDQAETLLKSTEALAIDNEVARGLLEHSIAVLIGEPASNFHLASEKLTSNTQTGLVDSATSELVEKLPAIPVGVPSSLLERRPDVAAAEFSMMSTNANIGVTKAAFFPALTIAASGGYQNTVLPGLFETPNRVWSVGPSLAMSLFDAGARDAAEQKAIAAYDQTVANYRQTVLVAFQNVEDSLITLNLLEQETHVQAEAVKYSHDVVNVTLNQYKAGIVSYLNVTTAQTTALANERTLMTLLSRRLTAHVGLVAATGGGWSTAALKPAK